MVILYYVLLIATLIYGLYFTLTGLWAFIPAPKKTAPSDTEKKNNFAIIIAARNEAEVIGNLIDSLNNQNYDRDHFTIYTAVNNCTDNTEYVARRHGSEVIKCPNTVKSKGDVLKLVFEEYTKREDIDAFIIFDADNIVHPDYLRHMNHAMNCGAKVAQCKRDSKNLADNWISAGYSMFYYLQNFFFNRARSRVGLSASINGTGFMVTKEALAITGFDAHTMTEDVEYTGICAINGVKIEYVEEAVTYDEQPTNFGVSFRQRKRWSLGNLQCWMSYVRKLFKTFFKTGRVSCLDMAFNYSAPIVQVVSVAMTVLLMCFPLMGIQLDDIFSYVFAYGWLLFGLTFVCGLVVCALILKLNGHSAKETPSGMLLFTVFILSWIPINCLIMVNRKFTWQPIQHSRNVSIDTLIQNK